ncbi:acyltransferase [Bacillus carboniphilus]|uniref:Acyltransferase n=1 Tax=Bacillus carboniphilus TaxID=86663 RepID=A0ABY9JVL9_9BACI|nr:acyltransferase [Bacillus carboniphilus]WLR42788.1 acyltransferase [Bacillus carboniphilus]
MKKIYSYIVKEIKVRGFYITVLMLFEQFRAYIRGYKYKIFYRNNIQSTFFFLQSNTTIDIFNKAARIKIGKFVFIRKNTSIRMDYDGELILGENVFINDNCTINCVSKISIGKQTKIASNVCINDHDHNYKSPNNQHLLKGEVFIGENVWIGSNVVILRDTIIENNCVIAAGSVVKGLVPEGSLFFNKRESETKPYYKERGIG